MVALKGDERIDYLLADQERRIIQSPTVFSFSIDAVLLANLTYLPIKKGKILDLCTGNAVIPLFLSKRSQASIYGLEIQERIFDMAKRNVEMNHLEEQIQPVKGDLKELPPELANQRFDVVTCNPPYFRTDDGQKKINENEFLAYARHEILCNLDDVLKACSSLVRSKGKVSLVHRPQRVADLITIGKKYNLEPKRLQFVHPKKGREANIVLIEYSKDGKPDLDVLPPIYIHDEDGHYTGEVAKILYGEEGSRFHGRRPEEFSE